MSQPRGDKRLTDVVAAVSATIGCVLLLWIVVSGRLEGTDDQQPTEARRLAPIRLPDAPVPINEFAVLGAPSAPVALMMFADFRCRYCREFATATLPELKQEYVDRGQLLLVFRHRPTPTSARLAEAAECARRQGRFWDVHDRLFQLWTAPAEPELLSLAASAGADIEIFRRCLQGEARDAIRADASFAAALDVRATPSFLIGTISGSTMTPSDWLIGAKRGELVERLNRMLMVAGKN